MSYTCRDCTVVTFNDEPDLRIVWYFGPDWRYRAEVYWQDRLWMVQKYSSDKNFSRLVERIKEGCLQAVS